MEVEGKDIDKFIVENFDKAEDLRINLWSDAGYGVLKEENKIIVAEKIFMSIYYNERTSLLVNHVMDNGKICLMDIEMENGEHVILYPYQCIGNSEGVNSFQDAKLCGKGKDERVEIKITTSEETFDNLEFKYALLDSSDSFYLALKDVKFSKNRQ